MPGGAPGLQNQITLVFPCSRNTHKTLAAIDQTSLPPLFADPTVNRHEMARNGTKDDSEVQPRCNQEGPCRRNWLRMAAMSAGGTTARIGHGSTPTGQAGRTDNPCAVHRRNSTKRASTTKIAIAMAPYIVAFWPATSSFL